MVSAPVVGGGSVYEIDDPGSGTARLGSAEVVSAPHVEIAELKSSMGPKNHLVPAGVPQATHPVVHRHLPSVMVEPGDIARATAIAR